MEISELAHALVAAQNRQAPSEEHSEDSEAESKAEGEDPSASTQSPGHNSPAGSGPHELTEEESKEVRHLEAQQREVRAHEQAHMAAAGHYARGGIHYEYETGPDGRRYIAGGEVSMDTSSVPGDPEATVEKAKAIRRAALAPAKPSPQDRQVAAEASRMAAEAQQEINAKQLEEKKEEQEEVGEEGVREAGPGPAKAAEPGIQMDGELEGISQPERQAGVYLLQGSMRAEALGGGAATHGPQLLDIRV